MASLNIFKYTKQQAGGLAVHMDTERRQTSKTRANEHIDITQTYRNYFIDCNNYREMYERANQRLKEVDAVQPPQRIVKERKTHLMIEFVCPIDLEEAGRDEEFFQKTYDWLVGYLGEENVHGGTVHRDEKHEYYDTVKRCVVESLEHMDIMASPYTETKGINCKAFMNRQFLRDIQKDFNTYFLREYGFEYNTHGRTKGRKVEDMKRASEAAEIDIWEKELVSYQEHKEDEVNALTDKAESLKSDVKDLEATKSTLEEENAKLHEEVRTYSRDYITAKTNVEQQLDKKREELKGLQNDIAEAKNEELDLSIMLEESKRKLEQLQKDYDKVQADYENAQAKTQALEDDYNHKYDDMKQLVKTFNEAIKYGEEDLAQLKLEQMRDYEDDLSR